VRAGWWSSGVVSGSEEACAVEQEVDGAVVQAYDVHVRCEEPLLDFDAAAGDYFGDILVKLLCQPGFGGCVEAGSSAFATVSVECEIAYEQDFAAGVDYAAVHFAGGVGEDSQVDELLRDELGVDGRVGGSDAEIDEQAAGDLADDFSFDLYFSL